MESVKDKSLEAIEHLREEVRISRRNIDDFGKRHFNGMRESAVIHCLKRAADIADGFILVAEATLVESANILERSLFEALVVTRWVTLSDVNAQTFSEGALNELKRILRKNLQSGNAKIFSRKGQGDKTAEFLHSEVMNGIPKRIRIEEIAKEAGLERIYTMYFGFQSLLVHGTSLGIKFDEGYVNGEEKSLYIAVMAAGGFMYAINQTTRDWIVKREQTSMAEILRILGIG